LDDPSHIRMRLSPLVDLGYAVEIPHKTRKKHGYHPLRNHQTGITQTLEFTHLNPVLIAIHSMGTCSIYTCSIYTCSIYALYPICDGQHLCADEPLGSGARLPCLASRMLDADLLLLPDVKHFQCYLKPLAFDGAVRLSNPEGILMQSSRRLDWHCHLWCPLSFLLAFVFTLGMNFSHALGQTPLSIVVQGDEIQRTDQMVHIPIQRSLIDPSAKFIVLESEATGPILAQVGSAWLLDQPDAAAITNPDDSSQADDTSQVWLTMILPKVPAQTTVTLKISADQNLKKGAAEFGWNSDQQPANATLNLGDLPALQLMGQAFDDSTSQQRDLTYKVFHHVYMPGFELPITKGAGGLFPHHRGLFYGFNKITVTQDETQAEIDTWHARKAHQSLDQVVSHEAGPVFGRQVLKINWVNEAVSPAKVFAVELRELVVVAIGDQRLIQFSSRLESKAGDIELKGDPQHAGFQFRASQQVADVTKGKTYYVRPDGKDEPGSFRNWPADTSHVDLPFHAMSFVLDNKRLTCIRLDQPQNPRPARFSERDYGRFGCYFEYQLKPEQPLEVKYQLQLIPGEIDVPTAQRLQTQFATPLKIKVETAKAQFPEPLAVQLKNLRQENTQPLFQGQPNGWDTAIRERGWIMYDVDHYKMWYTGYDGTREGKKMLGLATSKDGLKWERNAGNPIFTQHWVEDMSVVKHDGNYWMFAEGPKDVAHLLRSEDGITWQSLGPIDIRLTNGQPISSGPYGTPTALVIDQKWYLFYERHDQGIWVATSTDMKTWANVQDTPVMQPGLNGFDNQMMALNQVLPVADGFLAMLHGSGDQQTPRTWACTAAFSKDLIHWTGIGAAITLLPANQSSGLIVQGPQDAWFYTVHGKVDRFSGISAADFR